MARFGDELVQAVESAQRWAIYDPDPVSRGRLDALIDSGDPALIRLFDGRIAFGTAGLRSRVDVGPTHMNALVVRQTTAAVVLWLQRTGIVSPRVIIGFDARRDSQQFAVHAAAAVQAGGGVALCADAAAPTPVYAHASLAADADAAVVITASHNPPADNGYKLYLGDGLQLVSPADAEIAATIDELAAAWHQPGMAIDDAYSERDKLALESTAGWVADHRASAVAALRTQSRAVRAVYTAMHGVGGLPVVEAFRAAGFADPMIVEEQFEPDGEFPTVQFPNPEEPGAMDLAIALAVEEDADVVLANDPDADRLAIAVPDRSGMQFVALSGNELGVMLADHVLRTTTDVDNRLVARSVVSSRQLDAMAHAANIACEVTLTGFKWVARPIISHPVATFVFGYEEAIGYCVGNQVRDKDGVTAALVAAEMIAGLIEDGGTVWDRLDEIAAQVGVYASRPVTVRFDDDPNKVHSLMDHVAATPPTQLGGVAVAQSGPVGLGSLPPTSGLHLVTTDDTQVIIRPSGTEPKIKAYVEVIEPVTDNDVAGARLRASERLDAVVADVQALLSQTTA